MMGAKFFKIINIGALMLAIILTAGCAKSSSSNGWEEYFCNINYVYNLHTGILANNKNYEPGKLHKFSYDFNAKEYKVLRDKYNIVEIAGQGTEFKRAIELMNEFAPRLTHASDYDNHIDCNALDLLEYSLDQPRNGINCLNKSKILCEMCLACGIYARRVSIFPYSTNDTENHVVIEIFDSSYAKWIMLDMTSNIYFVDEKNNPLSLLEIRKAGAESTFCTAIEPGYTKSVDNAYNDNIYLNTYIMKDVFFFKYESYYGFGLSENSQDYYLVPENFDIRNWHISKNVSKANYYKDYKFNLISPKAVMDKP